MNVLLDKLKFRSLKKNDECTFCFSSSQLKVFYPHWQCPMIRKVMYQHLFKRHFMRFHHHPKCKKTAGYPLVFSLVSFLLCFSFENPFPLSTQACVLVSWKQCHRTWQSLSLPLMFSPVSPSPVALMVKAEGVLLPSLEIVDAVETIVLMSSDKSPLIARCCRRKIIY